MVQDIDIAHEILGNNIATLKEGPLWRYQSKWKGILLKPQGTC